MVSLMTIKMSLITSTTANSSSGISTEIKFKGRISKTLKKNFKKGGKIITALEKARNITATDCKLNVSSHNIENICKRKYIEGYKGKSETNAFFIDLKQSLLSWFELQISNEIPVHEEHLRVKAEEIASSLNNKTFQCTDVWLLDFRINNNIVPYRSTTNYDKSGQFLVDWLKLNQRKLERNDVYIGGTCGLRHSLDLDRFISSSNEQNQVSLLLISNMNGSDKQQLTVVGKEVCPLENETRSLPVYYYQCIEPLFNYNLLQNCLKTWDVKLKSEQRHILLFLDINEYFKKGLQLENIKLICSSELQFVTTLFRKIATCFKYHYRRLQVMQTFRYSKAISQQQFLEYINLMSLAWHCISNQAICNIFNPPVNGCLYFSSVVKESVDSEENDRFSLLQWCKIYDIPIKVEDDSILDKYVYCDEDLQSHCPDFRDLVIPFTPNVLHMLAGDSDTKSPMAIEVFQAMKRLIRYLQSENAPSTSIESAKTLEDNLEYEALLELQNKIQNDNLIENAD